jgi:hypothetical protein
MLSLYQVSNEANNKYKKNMNFSDFTNDYNSKFKRLDYFNIEHNQSDLYADIVQTLYNELQLPALWLDENGFSKGEATNEELFELVKRIGNLKLLPEPEMDYDNEPTGENDFTKLLIFLDKKLMNKLEDAYDLDLASKEEILSERINLQKEYEICTQN